MSVREAVCALSLPFFLLLSQNSPPTATDIRTHKDVAADLTVCLYSDVRIHTNPMFSMWNRQSTLWVRDTEYECMWIYIHSPSQSFFSVGGHQKQQHVIYYTRWKMSNPALRKQVVLTPAVALLQMHPPHTTPCMLSCIRAHVSVLIRSFIPAVILQWIMKLQFLASMQHLFFAAINAQTAVELPCPTIYKLHSGRTDPGGQLARVWDNL